MAQKKTGKKMRRVVLDAILTVMIVFEMFIQYTGEFLHEIIGFAFFATILMHILLSAKWIKGTANAAKRGKIRPRQVALAVMGALLAINTIVLAVSSIAISGLLADAGFIWTLGPYSAWVTAHAVSSYSLCALVVIHLGMHWAFLASAFHVPYNPARRRAIGTGVNVAAAAGAVALGVMAFGELVPSAANASSTGQSADGSASSSTSNVQSGSNGTTTSNSVNSAPRDKKPDGASPRTSTESGTSTSETQQSAPSSNTNSDSNNSSSGSSGVTGICTLCRKQCPLSDPKCDKPYQAGLI